MIPLVCRSHFSLMSGVDAPARLCRQAARLGYTSLALTDRGNLHGLWEFLEACSEEGLRPIVGAEVCDRSGTVVCLVENETGYGNLCQLLSQSHCDAAFALTRHLAAYRHGLILLTSNPGLLRELHDQGLEVFALLARTPNQENHTLRRLATGLGCGAVAVPDSFFSHPHDHAGHCLLRAIAKNTTLSRLPAEERAAKDAWLAAPQEYERRFGAWPETLEASRTIAERCTFQGPPRRLVMPQYSTGSQSPAALLQHAAYAGAQRRYGRPLPSEVGNRLDYELRVIEEKEFSSYFLLVRDIVEPVSRTCGRGSGAASLVAYCLGITNVCPIRYNLYFERFLNPGRQDPPDIDIDFAWDERDQVLERVLTEFGCHSAMVCSIILFQARMAVRETAKVFGLPGPEIKRMISRLSRQRRLHDPERLLDTACRQAGQGQADDLPSPWPEILSRAGSLIGKPRAVSVHPGGVVITPKPIARYVPVQMAAKGVPIIQWDKDAAEEFGLVKIDLLGNRSLGVVRDAIRDLRQNGHSLDEQGWLPEEDGATQKLLARGNSMGCFYIESPAMRLLQQKAGVGGFEHLVIHSSIIRPAANEFIREYLRRLQGGTWRSIHPRLDEILKETFGIMVFQEDVSRVAAGLAGFSASQADGLRKIISKKDRHKRLPAFYERFLAGGAQQGLSREQLQEIWRMILSFAGYSFCKAHSASYAKVSFQAAYLKAHFPAEFMAAVISNGGGFYPAFAYVSEARRLGLTILAPDVNSARQQWFGRDRTLRVGLMAVRDLSRHTRERIITCRQQRPFASVAEFMARVNPAQDEARMLIHAGCLDSLPPRGRTAKLWQCMAMAGQGDRPRLFAGAGECSPPDLPECGRLERLRWEYRALGFLLKEHPITLLNGSDVFEVKARDLPHLAGRTIRLPAWLVTGKLVSTKSGEPMEFLTFEDESGLVETVFFPKAYERYGHLLEMGRPYILEGKVSEDFGAVTLEVRRVSISHPKADTPPGPPAPWRRNRVG